MKPVAELLSGADDGFFVVKVQFLKFENTDSCGLALDIGQAVLDAAKDSVGGQGGESSGIPQDLATTTPAPSREAKPKALPQVGGVFEGKVVAVAKAMDDEWRVKLSDGTLIAFDRLTHEEKRRKIPEAVGGNEATTPDGESSLVRSHARPLSSVAEAPAGASGSAPTPTPVPDSSYLFAAVDNLTDLVGECYAECGADHDKTMKMLESLSAAHPVLKTAAPSWKDRAQRRMLVLDARTKFPEKHGDG